MAINIYKTEIFLALIVLLFSSHVNYAIAEQDESLFNFKFNHLSNIQSQNQSTDQLFKSSSSLASDNAPNFEQFDATLTYPWETKSMNIGVGLTLRHLSVFKNATESSGNQSFQEVLPLLHASALFALPLKGLSAGIEGTHLDSTDVQIFDYRAKVSYEWREGFGLQGGWQHQQFSLDNAASVGADYEKKGLYLDFYLNF